jgi:hypothetical protein
VCGFPDRQGITLGHWFYCAKHRVCWFIGVNLFSSWREEDEVAWAQNEEKLERYRLFYESVEKDLDLIPE